MQREFLLFQAEKHAEKGANCSRQCSWRKRLNPEARGGELAAAAFLGLIRCRLRRGESAWAVESRARASLAGILMLPLTCVICAASRVTTASTR